MNFLVSVIIPVFNSEKYLKQAIDSAINLKDVGEIILVNDGSTDSSLEICNEYAIKNRKVKLFSHPNYINLGPSASRNLGIRNAKFPYISFLDSDDWYLDNRFEKDKYIFETFSEVDVVYSCSIHERNLENNRLRYGVKKDPIDFWGKDLPPIQFYQNVLKSKMTLFDTNSVTIKRSFLLSHKLFDKRLVLHQDTELWLRLMRSGKFWVGEYEKPVSVVRYHQNHRITFRSLKSSEKMWCVLIDNLGIDNLNNFEVNIFFKNLLRIKSQYYLNSIYRRGYFYIYYLFNQFNKKKFIKRIIYNCDKN